MLGDITGVILNNVKSLDQDTYRATPKFVSGMAGKEALARKPANLGLKVVMSQL